MIQFLQEGYAAVTLINDASLEIKTLADSLRNGFADPAQAAAALEDLFERMKERSLAANSSDLFSTATPLLNPVAYGDGVLCRLVGVVYAIFGPETATMLLNNMNPEAIQAVKRGSTLYSVTRLQGILIALGNIVNGFYDATSAEVLMSFFAGAISALEDKQDIGQILADSPKTSTTQQPEEEKASKPAPKESTPQSQNSSSQSKWLRGSTRGDDDSKHVVVINIRELLNSSKNANSLLTGKEDGDWMADIIQFTTNLFGNVSTPFTVAAAKAVPAGSVEARRGDVSLNSLKRDMTPLHDALGLNYGTV